MRLIPKRKARLFPLASSRTLLPVAGVLLVMLMSNAVAVTGVTSAICNVADALSGPIALGIGVVMLAGGGIAVAAGGKRALGTVAWAVAGVAIAVSAIALVNMIFGAGGC
jgi:type IV secretory pathway VirB2 component (pilin)